MPKAAAHNECGLPMCAVAGLDPELSRERMQKESSAVDHGDTSVEES